jgi:hypothetical protein
MTQNDPQVSSPMRWPDFYVVGAPKCGTTSLYHYLRQHPQIFLPDEKEPHYFGADLIWRKRLVPRENYSDYYRNVPDECVAGDMSVFYLMSHKAAREIREVRPDAKIIVMLRDPMKVVRSLHRMTLKTGAETIIDLGKAIAAEDGRRRNGSGIDPSNPGLEQAIYYSEVGRYVEQIERYIVEFGFDSVHVILFEDFATQTLTEVAGVFEFLGVDCGFKPKIEIHNAARQITNDSFWRFVKHPMPRLRTLWQRLLPRKLRGYLLHAAEKLYSKPSEDNDLDVALKAKIRAMYIDDVTRLERLLGRDLSHWLSF